MSKHSSRKPIPWNNGRLLLLWTEIHINCAFSVLLSLLPLKQDLQAPTCAGTLPDGLTKATGLHTLQLQNASLVGTIPSLYGNLIGLSIFDFSNNSLSGCVFISKLTPRALLVMMLYLGSSVRHQYGTNFCLHSLCHLRSPFQKHISAVSFHAQLLTAVSCDITTLSQPVTLQCYHMLSCASYILKPCLRNWCLCDLSLWCAICRTIPQSFKSMLTFMITFDGSFNQLVGAPDVDYAMLS